MILRSIRSKLLGLVLAAIIPFVAFICVALWVQWQDIQATAIRQTMNDARLLAAQTVGPNAMAGALVTYNFNSGGDGGQGETVTGTFQPFSLRSGLASSADVSTPEPASLATFGAGMSLLFALAARRRRT